MPANIVVLVAMTTSLTLMSGYVVGLSCRGGAMCRQPDDNSYPSWSEIDSNGDGTTEATETEIPWIDATTPFNPAYLQHVDTPGASLSANIQRKCNRQEISLLPEMCNFFFSCHHRCGDKPDSISNFLSPLPVVCYCDSKCVVYKDCCHDFKDICFQEIEESNAKWSEMAHIQTKCLANTYTVINSCPKQTGHSNVNVKDPDELERESFLLTTEFVVTDKQTGFHFTNYTIYSCHGKAGPNAIFWESIVDVSPSTDRTNFPLPPSHIHARVCQNLNMLCGDQNCWLEDGIQSFAALCRSVSTFYKSRGMHAEEEKEEEEEEEEEEDETVEQEEDKEEEEENQEYEVPIPQELCVLKLGNINKDFNIEFGLLTRLSLFSKNSIISETLKDDFEAPWKQAECFGGVVESSSCQIRQCQDSHVHVGQSCLRPRNVKVMLEFRNDLEMRIFNVVKLLALLDDSWRKLNWTLNFSKTLSLKSGKAFSSSYNVNAINGNGRSHYDLPFTEPVLKDLEKMTKEERNTTTTVVPEAARICTSMMESRFRRIDSTLTSPPHKESRMHELCDVIEFFNSSSSSDWSVYSDYSKEARLAYGGEKTSSDSVQMAFGYASGMLFFALSCTSILIF